MALISPEVLQAAQEWWLQQKENQYIYGFIGKPVAENEYEYDVPGHPGLVYVRIANNQNEDLTLDKAVNFGALPHPKMLVRMERVQGYLVIQAPVPYSALKLYGKKASAAATAPTMHTIGSGNEDLIESRRILPGLVYPSPEGGMLASVWPFSYDGKWYQPPDLDLDGTQTFDPDTRRWVVVCVDTTTGEAVAIEGPEVPVTDILDEEDLWAIAIPKQYVPLTGIDMPGDQLELTTTLRFVDMRLWGVTAGTTDKQVVQARLSLNLPIEDSFTFGEALRLRPYKGNLIGLHHGSGDWRLHHLSDDVSIGFPLTTSTNYDVFAYASSEGVPTLELTAWSSDMARATALVTQDGVYVKSGDETKRYMGTIRTASDFAGNSHDYETNRLVWNYYNRTPHLLRNRSTSSHTYNGNNWRAWNNNGNLRFEFVVGVAEEQMMVEVVAAIAAGAVGTPGAVSVDLDGQSVSDLHGVQNANTGRIQAGSRGAVNPGIGFHYIQAIESGDATNPPTHSLVEINAMLNG